MQAVRMGYINTYDSKSGMATVIFPDEGGKISSELPFLNIGGICIPPDLGDPVVVLYRGKGASDAFIAGGFWNEENTPQAGGDPCIDLKGGACIRQVGGLLELKDSGGSITVAELLEELARLDRRISSLEN